MANLNQIQDILREATDVLCPSLQPAKVLRKLKSKGELTSGDVACIQSHARVDDQVDNLLEILRRKPESAYIAFMKALEIEREDLFWDIKKIEETYDYVPDGMLRSHIPNIINEYVKRVTNCNVKAGVKIRLMAHKINTWQAHKTCRF